MIFHPLLPGGRLEKVGKKTPLITGPTWRDRDSAVTILKKVCERFSSSQMGEKRFHV